MTFTLVPAHDLRADPHATPAFVDATTLSQWLEDGQEIALLDVREHGQYGEGHPFFAVHAAYSALETEIVRLVPRLATRIVLLDDGDIALALATRAAARLRALGYGQVFVLDGGAPAWAGIGRTLFQGVNLPSKTFGERVEHAYDVPHISAQTLADWQASSKPFVLLDGRTLEEHRKMTLPGALPVPNGELALRWRALVDDTTTPIVVHCAGRTRSIIGAQILRDLGVPNPVLALENGTQGWALAGLELERGSARTLPAAPTAELRDASRVDARAAAQRAGVPVLSVQQAQEWLDDVSRTTFVFDVRTAEEFAAGSLANARHAPGGQLLQAIDLQLAVRNSRVLLLDDDGTRAPVIALWLRRLGLDAAVIDGGIAAGASNQTPRDGANISVNKAPIGAATTRLRIPAPPALSTLPSLPTLSPEALSTQRDHPANQAILIDLRPSLVYRKGHADGAIWSTRVRLPADVRAATAGDRNRPVLLIAPDARTAELAAVDLREAGWQALSWVTADPLAAAGWPQVATPDNPSDAEAIDFLFFVHDRHEGNLDAARRYLDWETGLIAQCAKEELAVFRLP